MTRPSFSSMLYPDARNSARRLKAPSLQRISTDSEPEQLSASTLGEFPTTNTTATESPVSERPTREGMFRSGTAEAEIKKLCSWAPGFEEGK